jgi:hypothetical protein
MYQLPAGWPHPQTMSPYYAAHMTHWYNLAYNSPPRHDVINRHNHVVGAPENVPLHLPNQEDQPPQEDGEINAAGGGMALIPDNRRARDLVDYLYMLMMLTFLSMIGFYTGSTYQFIIFFIGVGIILLNQAGWFPLQRRNDNQQVEQQPEQEQQQQHEGNNEEANGPTPPVNQAAPANVTQRQNGGGFFATVFMFVTSFFSSLLPQQIPPEFQEN